MVDNTNDVVIMPLMLDGVIVGKVSVSEKNSLRFEIKVSSSRAYLKEMLLSDLVRSMDLKLDYIELPENHIPEPSAHLTLIKD